MRPNALFLSLFSSLAGLSAGQSECHDYVLISIRGTGEAQGPSVGFIGMINTTLHTIPGGVEYDAVYPAAPEQTAYLGADDVLRYITKGLKNCPSQIYAILGYSQGATAAGLALRKYTDPDSAGYKAIKAVLVIGNPYHRANETADVDQNGGNSTRAYSSGNKTGYGIPDIYYQNGELLDICYTGDVVCAPTSPGANFTQHLIYGGDKNVQNLGAKFLISKLSANATSSSSSTAPSTTPSSAAASSSSIVSSAAISSSTGATVASSASSTSGMVTPSASSGSSTGAAPTVVSNCFLVLVASLLVAALSCI